MLLQFSRRRGSVGSFSRLRGLWASLWRVIGGNFRHFAAVASVLLGSAPAAAAAFPDVSVECSRLGAGQDDEFLARLRLLLKTADPEALPAKLHAECSTRGAWIVWEGKQTERLKVEEGPNLVEALLDAVEERLARQREKPEAPETPAASEKPQPVPDSPWSCRRSTSRFDRVRTATAAPPRARPGRRRHR